MAATTRGLVYAVRGRVVLRHFGQLSVLIAAAAVPPLVASLAYGSWSTALLRAAVAVVLGSGGYALSRLRAAHDVQANEAMVVVALAFLVASTAAAVPLLGYGLTPVDAVFEAVSGVTTTGLSIVPSVVDASPDFLLARAWTQWYGGLGFVTLSVFLFAGESLVAQRLDPRHVNERDPVGGTRARGRVALGVYLAITGVGGAALLASGMPALDAATHALSSVSTGGFSSRDGSLAAFGVPARTVTLVLCVLGAMPFVLIRRAAQGSWRRALGDAQAVGLLVMGALGTVSIFLLGEAPTDGLLARLGHAAAVAFSAQTTAGFSTLDPGSMGAAALVVLVVAMTVGGGMGSTAGGIKIVRGLVAIRVLGRILGRSALPEHAVQDIRIHGKRLEPEDMHDVLALILLWLMVMVGSWLAFLWAGHGGIEALFEVASATGTVGLSTGLTGPGLEPGLKLVLCLDMLLGRLEIVALLVVLAPRTWIGRRRRSR